MPFPNSPTNGQTYVLNNTSYTYNSAQGTWTATQAGVSTPITIAANTAATSTGTGALQVVGGIGVQGNVYTGNVGFADGSVFGSASSLGTRNRIINGDMRIDQRYVGAATANTISGYTVDRWQVQQSVTGKVVAQQNAGSVTPPSGFTNYLGITSQSSYSVGSTDYYNCIQYIEGFNISDLAWGTSSALPVTLSFWVRSSLTGTFTGSINNGAAANNAFYPFSYSISSANTWTKITITIPGPTIGTWNTTNGIGLTVFFSLGLGSTYVGGGNAWTSSTYYGISGATSVVGTSSATFYITGVQLEQGSVATPFERRQFGQELLLCQRYFQKSYKIDVPLGTTGSNTGYVEWNWGSLVYYATVSMFLRTTMRTYPTFQSYNVATGAAGSFVYYNGTTSVNGTGTLNGFDLGTDAVTWYMDGTGRTNLQFHYTMTAEL
jgi:hypothetical protein